MLKSILILVSSITISSVAHVFLKKSVMSLGDGVREELGDYWGHIIGLATNPWMLGGVALHVCALVVWVWALSRVEVSFAYPFLALGYVFVSLLAWLWLGESLTVTRFSGMLIIMLGIVVLSRGG